mmetsp:Transcript_14843/g.39776  ORF Transcript_14843/g.39776 Transcript_14843/m.39776 type:complete len:383 (-) Transcript_14843:105-1253(-)
MFHNLPSTKQESNLSLYHPEPGSAESKKIPKFASVLTSVETVMRGKPVPLVLQKLALVCAFNAFDGGLLFALACRISHSCAPNCCRVILPDGRILIRAVRAITPNEELTISYPRENHILEDSRTRARMLSDTHGFVCDCVRCVEKDDMRAFQCDTPTCRKRGGQVWLAASNAPESFRCSPCSKCGERPTEDAVSRLVTKEEQLRQVAQLLDRNQEQITSVKPLLELHQACVAMGMSPTHEIRYLAKSMLEDWYKLLGAFGKPLTHALERAHAVHALVPSAPWAMSTALEHVADSAAGCANINWFYDQKLLAMGAMMLGDSLCRKGKTPDLSKIRAPFKSPPSQDIVLRMHEASLGHLRRVVQGAEHGFYVDTLSRKARVAAG